MRLTLEYPSEIPTAAPGFLAPKVLDSADCSRRPSTDCALTWRPRAATRRPSRSRSRSPQSISVTPPRCAVEQLRDLQDRSATWAIVHADASSVKACADYLTAFTDTAIRPWHDRMTVGAG
jgi:hypothetical protein